MINRKLKTASKIPMLEIRGLVQTCETQTPTPIVIVLVVVVAVVVIISMEIIENSP